MSTPAAADARPAAPPFGDLRPAVALAALYAVAALVWVAWGDWLPGGRWLAVHLFTLGVLSNLVVALTRHFAQTLLHTPGDGGGARLALLNVGALALLVGLPSGRLPLFVVGATALTAAVLWLYIDLRRIRKMSLTGRFAFVVRTYERACSAFVHGALLGTLLGVGLLSGGWYAAGRLAHLHINVLGWGGLTLLATAVFFGPTIMRVRMEPGADALAARALRHGATGLTVAALGLLLVGLGDASGLAARLAAAIGLAIYTTAALAVVIPILRAGRRAQPSASAGMLQAACAWLALVLVADVVIVATGHLRLLDALGAVMLVGVLGQAILAALGYLAPMALAAGPAERNSARERLDRLPWARLLALNAGVALVTAAAVAGSGAGVAGALVLRSGWVLASGAVLTQVALLGVTALRSWRHGA